MPDDPDNKEARERNRVVAAQDHEIEYFAASHGLSKQEVRDLIARVGNDRETLEREVAKLHG